MSCFVHECSTYITRLVVVGYFHGEYFESEDVYNFYCGKKRICLLSCQSNTHTTTGSSKLKLELDEYEIDGHEQIKYLITYCEFQKPIGTPQIEKSQCLEVQKNIILDERKLEIEASTIEESLVFVVLPIIEESIEDVTKFKDEDTMNGDITIGKINHEIFQCSRSLKLLILLFLKISLSCCLIGRC